LEPTSSRTGRLACSRQGFCYCTELKTT
jgi:hypothetical protein